MKKYYLDGEEIPEDIFDRLHPLCKAVIIYFNEQENKNNYVG